jgi:hypothetical protein
VTALAHAWAWLLAALPPHHLTAWLAAYAALSEIMGLLPGKYKGVAHALLGLLGRALGKTPAAALLFAAAVGASGCAALKQCEINALPQEKQDVLVAVTAAALNPTAAGAAVALEELAVDVGREQVSCAAQALVAAAQKPSAKPWAKAAAEKLAAFLAAHADAGDPYPVCRA